MKYIKKTVKYILLFFVLIISYLAVITLISYIPVNNELEKKQKEISIYILTNGVHTDIVLPLKNECHNWSKQLKPEHTKSRDTIVKYVALGWGDKGFYLETPTWNDLKITTALKAASGLSETAIHATFYKEMRESAMCKKIQISSADYKKLIGYVNESFQTKSGSFLKIETNAVYGNYDVFYEANGSYSLFYTCNSWANQALKAAQQKAALWTISDTGIFRHY
jgi:uncharacterized protein (TIGR02117 family)